jgi:predicted transcriptional regulator
MIVETQRRTTQIVAAYVRKNLIPTDQIAGLINSVHSTLSGLTNEVVEEPPRVPAVPVRRSVRPDYIICIECGYKGKMLKRHLQSRHGLSATEYRVRWKLPSHYSTTASNYSEQRSQLAKSIGLGRGPAQRAAIAAAATPETTPEKPARRRATSEATRPRTSVKKTSPKKASSRTSAMKANPKKASPKKISPKKASSRSSAKKASNRSPSRKPSPRAATNAASAPKAATA